MPRCSLIHDFSQTSVIWSTRCDGLSFVNRCLLFSIIGFQSGLQSPSRHDIFMWNYPRKPLSQRKTQPHKWHFSRKQASIYMEFLLVKCDCSTDLYTYVLHMRTCQLMVLLQRTESQVFNLSDSRQFTRKCH